MISRLIAILFFFIIFKSSAQVENGKIKYGVSIEMLEGLKENGAFKKLYTDAVENAKYLSFTLNFNKERAVFSYNDDLTMEKTDVGLSKVSAGYMNEVYQNKDFSLCAVNGYGNYLLKTDALKDWVLENETKEIEGFLCYKATSTKKVIRPEKTFVFPVIAWYCPKIPVSFGPNGYGNLPGLILELQVRNVVYGVKKIDLNLLKTPIMSQPKDYPVINQEEFDELVLNAYKNRNSTNGFRKPENNF